MKSIRIVVFLLLPVAGFALGETTVISTIEKVTVFTRGAEVNRMASLSLSEGDNILVFEKLSPLLDKNSLQFSGTGDYSVLSMSFEIRYDENKQKEKMKQVNHRLQELSEQVKTKKDLLAVSVSEENVLVSNTDFDIWEGMNVEQLKAGVDFVRERLIAVKSTKQKLRKEIDELNKERQKLINELQEARIEEAKPNAVVMLKLRSAKAQTLKSVLSYVVADAGWEAYYDLRVDDISKPMQIDYKANVNQNTGEDWSKVKLTLSTGNPYDNSQLSQLTPWFLNFSASRYSRSAPIQSQPGRSGVTGKVSGTVIDAQSAEAIPFANVVAKDQSGQLVAGTTTDVDGRFNLDLKDPSTMLEVSFIGYNMYSQPLRKDQFYTIRLYESAEQLEEVVIAYDAPLYNPSQSSKDDYQNSAAKKLPTSSRDIFIDGVQIAGSTAEADNFKISQNPITLKFEVNIPYDIPSGGGDQKVTITSYNREVDYLYQAVPKLNEYAFLTAKLTGWEELNLMDGKAGIYYEGNYLGETNLNVSSASDTLLISLGKDKNVIVRRKTLQETTSKKILSGKAEELFHYQIKIRNNKPAPIRLQITDQFPLSGNTEISVERKESTGGKVDEKSGLVNWDFTLESTAEKDLDLIYKVRYPKNKTVNLY